MAKKVYVTLDGTEFTSKLAAIEYQTQSELFDEETLNKRKEFLILKEKQQQAFIDIEGFQYSCEHKFIKIKSCSSTGNYDPSDNRYWYDIECKCCEYSWSEDQAYQYSKNSNVEWVSE